MKFDFVSVDCQTVSYALHSINQALIMYHTDDIVAIIRMHNLHEVIRMRFISGDVKTSAHCGYMSPLRIVSYSR